MLRLQLLALTAAPFVLAPAALAQTRVPDARNAMLAPRERIAIDSDWRFHLGDPGDASHNLLYDVRPAVSQSAEGRAPDAEPQETARSAEPAEGVLKPWILPTANPFIRDPARRHVRPPGDPGGEVSFVRPDFDDSSWQTVNLPHDWAIQGPFLREGPYGGMGRLRSWGPVWYRKRLAIPAHDRGKSIFLDVDGAMSYSTVWLNGRLVGGWPYGYSSWRVDLTPYVIPGRPNQLAIRLDNPPESSRWYPGSGLYRDIWLTKTSRVRVGQWGTFVATPKVSTTAATVELDTSIDNDTDTTATVDASTEIYDLNEAGTRIGRALETIANPRVQIAAHGKSQVHGSGTIPHPRLWGPPPHQHPNRYLAVTTLRQAGRIIDRYETRFGVRSLRFDPNHGLYVNEEPVPLNGVNLHHDLGALGSAFNYRAAERQLEKLGEMGANALRMSHNPPAPELLELADRMGFVVIDEIFDAWERGKTPLDFHLIFRDWYEPDLRSLLRRDRNHPAVVLWSVGNEVGEQYTGAAGAQVAGKLVAIAHEEDPTRPTMTAMNWAKPDMPLPAAVDVVSLNYQGAGIRSLPGNFPAFHAKFPGKVILSSESAAALSTRGDYQFPVPGVSSAPVRPGVGGDPHTHQVSAYELFAADFGSSPDRAWAAQDQNPYVAGEFVWSGWDYLGEPNPPYSSSRSSYYGIVDLAGFEKDRFYLYQSRWRPELPMVHILPHWSWPERVGEVTPVQVFTSGDEAELFLNGQSLGRKKKAPYEYRLRWDYVTYQPGELKVVAYRNGSEWATATVKTAGAPAALAVTADRAAIRANGRDLAFVNVRVVDKDGLTAPRAANLVRFTIEGPGEIVATDNGDPTSFESFQSPERQAFNGLCLVIVRASAGRTGKLTLRAESASLRGASVVLTSVRPGQ